MELPRQNPDELLRAIHNEVSDTSKGKLKIFFAMRQALGKPMRCLRLLIRRRNKALMLWQDILNRTLARRQLHR